jgi:L-asparagine transporter-like permease
MQNIFNSIPPEVSFQLVNLGKIVSLTLIAVFIIVGIVIVVNKQKNKDYSDQTGYKNFRFFDLGWVIIVIIVLIVFYSILLGISI